jgi:hypothetical protein
MASIDTGPGSGGTRPGGTSERPRNAYCSFCRKSYRDIGPLAEGPDNVYICTSCVDLCQAILDQENCRRSSAGPLAYFWHKLDRIAKLVDEMKSQLGPQIAQAMQAPPSEKPRPDTQHEDTLPGSTGP